MGFIAQRYLEGNAVYSGQWIDIPDKNNPDNHKFDNKEDCDRNAMDQILSGALGSVNSFRVVQIIHYSKIRQEK